MKKNLIPVFIFLVIVTFASACQNAQEKTTLYPDYVTFGHPITLLDEQDIRIVLKSSNQLSPTNTEIVLEVENKTDHIYDLKISPVRINDIGAFIGSYSFDLKPNPPNQTQECILSLEYEQLKQLYDVDNIHTITFLYSIRDSEKYELKYNDLFGVSRGNKQENLGMPEKYLIGSDDYFDIYFVGARLNNSAYELHTLLFYNKSNEPLYFDLKSLAINNISIPTYSHIIVEPKSYYFYINRNGYYGIPNISALSKTNEVASAQIDFRGYKSDSTEYISSIQAKLVLDESIKLKNLRIKGQVIYDQNDIVIKVDKVKFRFDNSSTLILSGWYLENNSDKTCYAVISNTMTDPEIADHPNVLTKGIKIPLTVLPGTYTFVIAGNLRFPLSSENYKLTADLTFYNEDGEPYEETTFEFNMK